MIFFSKAEKTGSGLGFSGFRERERESSFSLDFLSFGSLVLDGARSKVDLRGEGGVGTDFVEFRQLQEVGIFSYLCYFLDKSHVNG